MLRIHLYEEWFCAHNSTYDLKICLLCERAQLRYNNTNIFLLWTKKEFADYKLNLPVGVNKSISHTIIEPGTEPNFVF